MKPKRILLLIIFIIMISGSAYFYFNKEDNAQSNVIKLYGNVEIRQVLLGFRASGRLENIHFEEGEDVKEGALLGILDPVPYEIKMAESTALLAEAQANLEKIRSGNRLPEIQVTEANRNQIRASLELAETEFNRLSRLFSEKAVSKNDLDKATSNRDSLRAQLESASASLALMREGSRSEDIRYAEAAVELATAQFKYASLSLQDTKLYSPSDGTILTRITEPGSIVATGQPVYALALKKPLQVRAYITEPQLEHVRLGMKGKIYTDSFLEPIDGTINFISSEAEFTPKQVQTPELRTSLVYRIRLLIEDNPDERLKNGMPVTIEIPK
ncbi:MAG: HlyD family efflux transporter periplasmic adaptor subunit [Synergistaceae bacterium]|nr:HlyD family efflux transporter periplasmic adaptor subunit [Synergistaceae bacterium]